MPDVPGERGIPAAGSGNCCCAPVDPNTTLKDKRKYLMRQPYGRAFAMSFGSGRIWMNGGFVDWADAKIHVGSHVVHYGSGVFEGIRSYDTPGGSVIFRLDAHLRRFYDSAKVYRMTPEMDRSDFREAVLETIRVNGYAACYIRPLLYRGYHSLGVNPFTCPVEAAILVWEWGAYLGEDALEKGVDVQVSSWSRPAPNTFPAMAKSTANYANSQLIKMEATLNGYDEAIALDPSGLVSEGSGQNIFVIRDGVIFTPPMGGVGAPGHHAGRGHHARPRPRDAGRRAARAARNAVRRRRGLLHRHRRGDLADPEHRQDHDRGRRPRPGHRGHSAPVLRHRQRPRSPIPTTG